MTTENEKQLTAVMMLREKLQVLIDKEHYHIAENALKVVRNMIDTELLATERQQLIDFGIKMQLVRDIDTDGNVAFAYDSEKQFEQTFKTQQ